MELALLAIILIFLPLFKLPSRIGGAFIVKETAFFILAIAYLIYVLLFKQVIYTPLALLALWVTFSVMWSTNIEESWQDITKWWALYGLFILVSSVSVKTVLIMSIIPIPFFLLWGFLQHFGEEPFDSLVKKFNADHFRVNKHFSAFCASIGNSNHSAAFMAPYVFITIYLSINISLWFSLLLPPLLIGVVLTRCYSAMMGVLAGMCFMYPPYSLWLLLAVPIGVCVLIYLKTYRIDLYERVVANKESSITARFHYVKIAFKLWKKHPIIGWGIRTFRKEIYECQAEMNKIDPSLLGYKDDKVDIKAKYTPYPTRVHNDYIEMLSDCGIIGAALLMFFVGTSLYSAIISQNYILLGGLICLMVHGCLFYTLSTFSFVPYILLVACVSRETNLYTLPIIISCIIVCALIKLVISYAINIQRSLAWVVRINTAPQRVEKSLKPLMEQRQTLELEKQGQLGDRETAINDYEIRQIDRQAKAILGKTHETQAAYVAKAIELSSTEGHVLAAAVNTALQTDPWLALYYMERAIHMFDGELRLPGLWAKLGDIQRVTGNWEGAKRSLNYALYLDPCLIEARQILKHMHDEEQEVVTRNQQITNLVKPPREVQAA
jgi:hypothetical protein